MQLIQSTIGLLLMAALASCAPKTFSPVTVTLSPGVVGTNFNTNYYQISATALAPAVTGLNSPMDICFDTSGNFYICDAGNNQIKKYNSSEVFVTGWGSAGAATGQFNHPAGIVYHPSGYIFVSDRSNHRIQRFLPDGSSPIAFGSFGTGNTQFKEPIGLAVDKWGYLYVCDWVNCRVVKYDVNGNYQNAQFGSKGSGTGNFSNNAGIAINNAGTIYVSDNSNYKIKWYNQGFGFLLQWGSTPGSAFGQYDVPWGLAFNSSKEFLLQCDMMNNRFYQDNINLYSSATYGSAGVANNQFNTPRGLSYDLTTNAYICDSGNNRICKWNVLKMVVQTNIITNQI
ncbi:MAG: NHL repeat-containing protein [Spirochaetia bacterium]|nr:NHL repeat-containing protein [Spirochaetia bacterium]